MTKRQRIDAAREARLWMGQVLIPAAGLAAVALSNPETREKAKGAWNKCVTKVKTVFKKEEAK